jgi:hypothetical protein
MTRPGRVTFALAALVVLTAGAVARFALIITPAAHDFGQVIVGAQGTNFQFKVTVPPGGGPANIIHRQYGGTNALDFRDYSGLFLNVGPNIIACADSIPQSGICYFWVEFIPHALGPRSGTIQVWDNRGNSGTATLTGTGIFGCTMYEGLCSYAGAYSGTVSWSGALSIQQGAGSTSGPRRIGTWTNDITVSVVNGVATCQGSSVHDEKEYEGTRLDQSRKADGVVSGPGIVTVEFKKEDGQLVYQITAACPSAQVTETFTDYLSGQTSTTTSKAKPADWRDRTSIDPDPASAVGMNLLSGSKTFPHPDEDPLNGVTGKMTFTWSLKRS